MTRESLEWLNTNTRIGDTDKRGMAWHYRAGATNHYPGAIPVDDVEKLIVPFEPTRQPIYVKGSDGKYHEIPNFIGMAAENAPDDIYAIHSAGYQVHNFKKNLVDAVSDLVGVDDLHISSAGILARGSVAWVEVAITDTMVVEGFPYRPHLLAVTSSNGRYETSWSRKIQAVVCDNTLDAAEREQGQKYSIRHTAGSLFRLEGAAEAVGLIMASGAAFEDEFRALEKWKVEPRLFSRWLDLMIPEKAKDGGLLSPAAQSRVEKKRDDMAGMWRGDPRVAPWNGTAFGVLQLNNTWQHHAVGFRGETHSAERNMLNAIGGQTGASDMHALGILRGLSDAYGYHVPEQFESLRVPELVRL